MYNCLICNNQFRPKRMDQKFCSTICRNKNKSKIKYKKHKKFAINIKEYLIFMSGGSCNNCGYNKHIGALCYHHLYNKQFTLDITNIQKRYYKQYEIFQEWNKCILLCHNCHAMEHYKGFRRHHDKKLDLVKQLGGYCKSCCLPFQLSNIVQASFHHKNPNNKNFHVTIRSLSKYGFDKCQKESKLCELYCLNCHMELHH